MYQQRKTIAGKSPSKVVLIVALLLSLLSFSDQAIYQSNKHHSVKTEQIISSNKFSRKSSTNTNASPYENITATTYSNHQRLRALLAHTRSVNISIEQINREILTFSKSPGFFIFSDVTHNSDEDDRISTRG